MYGRQPTIVRQKLQPGLPQCFCHFPLDPSCDAHAAEGAVGGFDAVESARAAFFEEVFLVGGFRGYECAEGGEG